MDIDDHRDINGNRNINGNHKIAIILFCCVVAVAIIIIAIMTILSYTKSKPALVGGVLGSGTEELKHNSVLSQGSTASRVFELFGINVTLPKITEQNTNSTYYFENMLDSESTITPFAQDTIINDQPVTLLSKGENITLMANFALSKWSIT